MRFFPLAEVQAFDMEHSWDEVDEEEPNDCSVDVDDVVDVDLEDANHEADPHHHNKVNDLAHFNFASFRLFNLKNMEDSPPALTEKHLLMRVNSGKTE